MPVGFENKNTPQQQQSTDPSPTPAQKAAVSEGVSLLSGASFTPSATLRAVSTEPVIATSVTSLFIQESDMRIADPRLQHRGRLSVHFSVDPDSVLRGDVVADVCASFKHYANDPASRTQLLETLVSDLAIDRGRDITRSEYLIGTRKDIPDLQIQSALIAEESITALLKLGLLKPSEIANLVERDDYPQMSEGLGCALSDYLRTNSYGRGSRHLSSAVRPVVDSLTNLLETTDSPVVRERIAHMFHNFERPDWFDQRFQASISSITQKEAMTGSGGFSKDERNRLQSIYQTGYSSRSEAFANNATDFSIGLLNFTRNVGHGMVEMVSSGVESARALLRGKKAEQGTERSSDQKVA